MTEHRAVPPYSKELGAVRNATEYLATLGGRGTLYLAGPMRGLAYWNARAFDYAAARWRSAGWQVINPIDLGREHDGLDPLKMPPHELGALAASWDWLRRVILYDLQHLARAHALALLPGWQRSSGSTVEVATAQFLGLPLFCAVTEELVPACPVPWSRVPTPRTDGDWAEVWRGLPDRLAGGAPCVTVEVSKARGPENEMISDLDGRPLGQPLPDLDL
jgi:hypothetical protein